MADMIIHPINHSFVAEISGVDLKSLTENDFKKIYEAWLTYGVLRIRLQQLDEDALQSFSARFGPLEEIPMGRLPESAKATFKHHRKWQTDWWAR